MAAPAGAVFDVGSIVFVNYGDAEYHERLIGGHVERDEYLVVTPDMDMYAEQLSGNNPDLFALRMGGAGGLLPFGIQAGDVYGFGAITAAERAAILLEAGRLCAIEKGQRGLVAAPGAALVPVAAAAVHVPAALPPAPAQAAPAAGAVAAGIGGAGGYAVAGGAVAAMRRGGVRALAPAGGMWVLDEPLENFDVGEEFALPAGAARMSDRALVLIDDEVGVLKFLEPGVAVSDYTRERKAFLGLDARTLPGGLYVQRPFADAIRDMVPEERDPLAACPITGPRTATWWLDQLLSQGYGGLIARHHRWRAESGVNATDRVVYEHEVLSRVLEVAATLDGVNLKNCLWAELVLRRIQLQEEAVSEDGANPSYEGASHWMGTGERKGGALIAPSLRAFVAGELSREAAVLKEKRKARESKLAARGGGGGGGGRGRGRGGRGRGDAEPPAAGQ